MTTSWQQAIRQHSDPAQWRELKQKLDASLDPGLCQQGLVENYYLPLFFHLYKQVTRNARPGFIAGINAPQGGGKSTLTSYLVQLFDWSGLNAVTLSIDDFYLTRAEQIRLATEHTDNPYLQQRGYPGTHAIKLGADVLTQLKHPLPGQALALPRYDKSRHGGQGDRAEPSLWPTVQLPVDVVLLEGWMLGFRPVSAESIEDPKLARINTLLQPYEHWHRLLDSFIHICPDDPAYVVDWRSEAEERMKAKGLPGMSAAEVRAYAEKFLPAYRLYVPQLVVNPPVPQAHLHVPIGKNRLPVHPP